MTRKFYQKLGPYNKEGEEGKNINPNKVTALNDDVEVKVIEIDDEKRRVSLSIKQCQDCLLYTSPSPRDP